MSLLALGAQAFAVQEHPCPRSLPPALLALAASACPSHPFSQMGIPAGPRKELLLSHWDVGTVAALSDLRVSVTVLTLSPKPTLL